MACDRSVGCVRPLGHEGSCCDGMLQELGTPSSVRVTVMRASGNSFNIDADRYDAVGHVKRLVSGRLQLPSICLKFIKGVHVMEAGKTLEDYCPPPVSSLAITVIVSPLDAESFWHHLQQLPFLSDRVDEVRYMEGLLRTQGEVAIPLVAAVLVRDRGRAREVALSIVRKLQAEGLDFTMSLAKIVCTYLKDSSKIIRAAAIGTLGDVCKRGNADFSSALEAVIVDEDYYVRLEAMQQVPKFFEPGSDRALELIVRRIGDDSHLVRKAAILLLPSICRPGDERVIDALIELLALRYVVNRVARHSAVDEKCAAFVSLSIISKKGDDAVLRASSALFKETQIVKDKAWATVKNIHPRKTMRGDTVMGLVDEVRDAKDTLIQYMRESARGVPPDHVFPPPVPLRRKSSQDRTFEPLQCF
eukprot:TRINITY_DN67695_c0_g1_i1.p1 TRINITY_DN67695_c0_g1~~TRINITY_DN67695_c0_g1_i1.p1  ORF type:complete len:417 (-),score=34.30 TRINITY_DN67695_c0_g1_i1:248-1498(-)